MRIVSRYSHLNGEEALRFRQGELWDEIIEVIESVDAESCRTKVSRERTRAGRKLYSPIDMKELEREMSSGVPYYERDLRNILRQGRNIPAVPLVIIGIAP